MQRTIVRESHSYKRKPPHLFSFYVPDVGLRSWILEQLSSRAVDCPAEWVAEIKAAYVYEGSFILTDDIQWLEESVADYGVKELVKTELQKVIKSGHCKKDPYYLPGYDTVVFSKAGFRNYGHFLVEIAPKLLNLKRHGLNNINLLVPDAMTKFDSILLKTASALSLNLKLTTVPHADFARLENFYYAGPISRHNRRKSEVLMEFRDIMKSGISYDCGGSERLYVSRPYPLSRSLSLEVEHLLAELGFRPVDPMQMSIEDQIRSFSFAKSIVGPLGAGLTNTLFSPEDASVLMLDPGLADFFFWDLSCLQGQDFFWVFTDEIRQYDENRSKNAIHMDAKELARVLRVVGGDN